MAGLRAPQIRAIDASHEPEALYCRQFSAAAMLDRGDKAACVIDADGRLLEANAGFEHLLRQQKLYRQTHGRITMASRDMAESFVLLTKQIASTPTSRTSRLMVADWSGNWLLSFSRLPSPAGDGQISTAPYVLVLATSLAASVTDFDMADFSRLFSLTRSEARLCQALAARLSLPEAATRCDISYETARSRLKDIFLKTQTSRQADLLLLLEQFRTG